MPDSAPITVEAALSDVDSTDVADQKFEYAFSEAFSLAAVDAEERWVKISGLRDHFRHRTAWSYFLMVVVGGMVIFQSVLIGMVGSGKWDYTHYQWLLPTLMIQYLTQIIGLAVFVVRFLFNDPRSH